MKSITLDLDDETFRRTEMLAAAQDTSVSAFVAKQIEKIIGSESECSLEKRRERFNTAFDSVQAQTKYKVEKLNREDFYEERLKLR